MNTLIRITLGLVLAAALPAMAADWPVRDDHDHTVPGSREERAKQAYEHYLQTKPLVRPAAKGRSVARASRNHRHREQGRR